MKKQPAALLVAPGIGRVEVAGTVGKNVSEPGGEAGQAAKERGTMAKYRYFRCGFWTDPYIQKLQPLEKLLYAYLFTNEHTSQSGVYTLTVKTIAHETDLNSEFIGDALRRFETDSKVRYVDDILWVKNFLKYQVTISPTIQKRIAKELLDLNGHYLVQEFLEINDTLSIGYQQVVDTPDTLSIGYQQVVDTPDTLSIPIPQNKNKKRREEKRREEKSTASRSGEPDPPKRKKGEVYAEESREMKAARRFFRIIEPNLVRKAPPNFQTWAHEFHLLFDIDGLTEEQVFEVAEWCASDEFEKSNVLSPSKLRKRFDQLFLESKRVKSITESGASKRRRPGVKGFCSLCNGMGKVEKNVCPKCGGNGYEVDDGIATQDVFAEAFEKMKDGNNDVPKV